MSSETKKSTRNNRWMRSIMTTRNSRSRWKKRKKKEKRTWTWCAVMADENWEEAKKKVIGFVGKSHRWVGVNVMRVGGEANMVKMLRENFSLPAFSPELERQKFVGPERKFSLGFPLPFIFLTFQTVENPHFLSYIFHPS